MFQRKASLSAATLTPAGHSVSVSFIAQPVGAMIGFIVTLFATNSPSGAMIAQSAQTTAVAATGTSQTTPTASISLSGVAPGDFYVGVTPFINGLQAPTTMLAAGTDIIVSGIAISGVNWT